MNKKFVKKADEHSLVHNLNVYEIYISGINYTLYKDTHIYSIFTEQGSNHSLSNNFLFGTYD